jgi:integrase
MKAYVVERNEQGKPIRWAVALEMGKIDGKRRRKMVYSTKSGKDAEQKAARLAQAAQQGLDLKKDKRTLAELLSRWLEHTKGRVAPLTWESYRHVAESLITPELGAYKVTWLTVEDVDSFLTRMGQRQNPRTKKPYAPSYILKIRAVLRRALNQGKKWGYVGQNVAALSDPPKLRKKKPRALSDDQIKALLAAVSGHRFAPIYHTLVKLGMRRGEVLAIRREDLDLAAGLLLVTGSVQRQAREVADDGPKSHLVRNTRTKSEEGDDRVIVLPPSLVPILRAQLERQELERVACEKLGRPWQNADGLIFTTPHGTPIEPSRVTRHFREELGPAAKLPAGTRLHDLRHANISAMISSKVDPETARERAGHSDVRVTLGVYTHSNLDLQRAAAAAIDTRFHVDESAA